MAGLLAAFLGLRGQAPSQQTEPQSTTDIAVMEPGRRLGPRLRFLGYALDHPLKASIVATAVMALVCGVAVGTVGVVAGAMVSLPVFSLIIRRNRRRYPTVQQLAAGYEEADRRMGEILSRPIILVGFLLVMVGFVVVVYLSR